MSGPHGGEQPWEMPRTGGVYHCLDHPGPLDDARDHVCRLRPGPDPTAGESTSARLRRVEQELAQANEYLANAVVIAVRNGVERDDLKAELATARAQRDQAQEMWETARQSHELTLAELATARAELTHLRRERDQLRTDLTEALDELQRMHAEWGPV
jgi:hypothetical protein